jgi:hypothetical protein
MDNNDMSICLIASVLVLIFFGYKSAISTNRRRTSKFLNTQSSSPPEISEPNVGEPTFHKWAKNPALPNSIKNCRKLIRHLGQCANCKAHLQVAMKHPPKYPKKTKAVWEHIPFGINDINQLSPEQELHLWICETCNKRFSLTNKTKRV